MVSSLFLVSSTDDVFSVLVSVLMMSSLFQVSVLMMSSLFLVSVLMMSSLFQVSVLMMSSVYGLSTHDIFCFRSQY